jgi:mannose-1-phosphate guanylyltransferase/mannose-6-phosphate isomerase
MADTTSIRPVILCGGSGTRLWPLSRKAFPKQFIPLVQGKSLLQLTVERLQRLDAAGGLLAVSGEEHRFLVSECLEACGAGGAIILEPAPRNTAAAIALACLAAQPQDLLLICPSDHHIPDTEAFAELVRRATPAALGGAIVTFGAVPTFPSTAYGYIEVGQGEPDGRKAVHRFIEKPAVDVAQQMLLAGNVLWNVGIFFCRADTMREALAQHAPDILASCEKAWAASTRDGNFIRPEAASFKACRSESIDVAVMQKSDKLVVFPFSGAWSDVGSWNAAAELTPADAEGNRVQGKGSVMRCKDTFVHAPHRRVVAIGTTDLIIVDTPDALLVAHKSAAEEVRHAVARLEQESSTEAVVHRKVYRPWGWYDSIDQGDRFRVKRLFVKPGASLSLQMHHHRAEHWVVVRGTAEVTRADDVYTVTENESTYIPLGHKHRLRNPGKIGLELIEVQSGTYLEEDDIVRFDDAYGRQG